MARPNEKIQEIRAVSPGPTVNEHQDSWSQYLPWAEYAQKSLRQEATGLTPFQCVLGIPAANCFLLDRGAIGGPSCRSHGSWSERGMGLSSYPSPAEAVRRHKANTDTRRSANPIYQPGDRVWLSTRGHLTSSLMRLISRLQDSLCWSMPTYLARPSWNSSLPVETQV